MPPLTFTIAAAPFLHRCHTLFPSLPHPFSTRCHTLSSSLHTLSPHAAIPIHNHCPAYSPPLSHPTPRASQPSNNAISTRLCNALIHNALQNGPFQRAKRPISYCISAHFTPQNGTFRKTVWQVYIGQGIISGKSTIRYTVISATHLRRTGACWSSTPGLGMASWRGASP